MRVRDGAYRVGMIRVMTLDDSEAIQVQGKLIESMYPSLKILSWCIPYQYEGIYDEQTQKKAEPKIIQLGRKIMKDDIDALIVSCAADPAVESLRHGAVMPVIGGGSAVAYAALSVSCRIGVLGISTKGPDKIEKILGEKCTGYRKIPEIHNASEISPQVFEGALDQAGALVAQGADTIILACAGLAATGLSQQIYGRLGVISLDPVQAAGSLANQILSVKKRRTSLNGRFTT